MSRLKWLELELELSIDVGLALVWFFGVRSFGDWELGGGGGLRLWMAWRRRSKIEGYVSEGGVGVNSCWELHNRSCTHLAIIEEEEGANSGVIFFIGGRKLVP